MACMLPQTRENKAQAFRRGGLIAGPCLRGVHVASRAAIVFNVFDEERPDEDCRSTQGPRGMAARPSWQMTIGRRVAYSAHRKQFHF